jgi:polyisoprenyl-phosphate glycosyltransferase
MIVKNDMKKVTLLIPVYNEEAMLPTLYQRLIELVNRNAVYEWEIVISGRFCTDWDADYMNSILIHIVRVQVLLSVP